LLVGAYTFPRELKVYLTRNEGPIIPILNFIKSFFGSLVSSVAVPLGIKKDLQILFVSRMESLYVC